MSEYWSTNDEIKFIKTTVPPSGITRYAFLKGYQESMKFRRDWDGMDQEVIEKTLNKEIEKEIQNGGYQ